MVPYFMVAPEDAGIARPHRRTGLPLYVFDTWLGDDLVRAHPVFLATTSLKNALETLPEPAGFRSERIRVARSPFLRRQRPDLRLPTFWALEIHGRAGVHPLGLSMDGSLVLSLPALECLVQHTVAHAQFSQYVRAAGTLELAPRPQPLGRAGPFEADAETGKRRL